MKINGMREKHVLREATRDVIIDPVYNREKHPFSTPPAQAGTQDAMFELYADTFSSKLLDDQPIFDPEAVRDAFQRFEAAPSGERMLLDGFLNRVLSMTLMHERFGMSG